MSDELAADADHLAEASGVRVVIDMTALVTDTEGAGHLREAASALGIAAEELALFGGEDYAVLFTAPAGVSVGGAVKIGRIEALTAGEDAVAAQRADGSRRPLRRGGYDHFR